MLIAGIRNDIDIPTNWIVDSDRIDANRILREMLTLFILKQLEALTIWKKI